MTVARYDAAADFYEAGWRDTYDDPATVALFDLLGPLDDLRVLDAACGHGRVTRELARRGAVVVGVDVSAALLEKARVAEQGERLGIGYVHADVASDWLPDGETFDAVACSFGLSDIDDLDACLRVISAALRPAGRLVFSMPHPCFPGAGETSGSWPSSGSYYDEGWWLAGGQDSSLRRQVGSNHRTLSTYVNTLRSHELILDCVVEPSPPPGWADKRMTGANFPVLLVGRCIKG